MRRIPAWAANLRHDERARDVAFCLMWAALFGVGAALVVRVVEHRQHAVPVGVTIAAVTFAGLFISRRISTEWKGRLTGVVSFDIALLAVIASLITNAPSRGEAAPRMPDKPADSPLSPLRPATRPPVVVDSAAAGSSTPKAGETRADGGTTPVKPVRPPRRPAVPRVNVDQLSRRAQHAMDTAEALGRERSYVAALQTLDDAMRLLTPHRAHATIDQDLSRLESRRSLLYDVCINDEKFTGPCHALH